jgi:UDP-2,3-diacylglucosamine hydrolase
MIGEPSSHEKLGVLAGRGIYPGILIERLLERGNPVVVAGILGQFCQKPPGDFFCDAFPLGAIEQTTRYFRRHGVKRIFWAGGIDRVLAWGSFRPDLKALALLPQVLVRGDDQLLRLVADQFSKAGVEVSDPAFALDDVIAKKGTLAGPMPNARMVEEIELAYEAARELGVRDEGQAAVVYKGKVVGLEDRRGTDALIAEAPGPGGVLVKVVKPGQDRRFDRPAIGPSSALIGIRVGIKAIAVEADEVLLLGRKRLYEICKGAKISLLGI